VVLNNIGEVLKKQGATEAARARYAESLEISRPIGDKGLVAETLAQLASVAVDPREAEGRLEEALGLFREAGEKVKEIETLRALADVVERRDKARSLKLREDAKVLEQTTSP
jgi:tetratricopeptide (TPR) repeat protein